jgi:hypothetical protein
VRIYSDQDLRELLEATLDRNLPMVDRRNAAIMLRTHLGDALEGATDVRCRPCRSGSHDRCLRPFIGEGADFCCCAGMDALEGAEGVRPTETP